MTSSGPAVLVGVYVLFAPALFFSAPGQVFDLDVSFERGRAPRAVPRRGIADRFASAIIAAYQPWWAARARAQWLAGDETAAWTAARTAAGLSSDPSVRRFCSRRSLRHETGKMPARTFRRCRARSGRDRSSATISRAIGTSKPSLE